MKYSFNILTSAVIHISTKPLDLVQSYHFVPKTTDGFTLYNKLIKTEILHSVTDFPHLQMTNPPKNKKIRVNRVRLIGEVAVKWFPQIKK